jgi:hypothetical protein
MRVVALVACLAALSMGVLRPLQVLAQATATSEARSSPRLEGQTARTQSPRTSRPGSSATGAPAPTPVPPSFYSMGQLGDHLHSVRWELAIVGAAIATIGIKDWDWGNGDGFQTIEEGWFAKNTRHGGMDKIGHSFSTYVIADLLTDRIRANASDPAGAPITASLVAFGIMGLVETLDGFTGLSHFSTKTNRSRLNLSDLPVVASSPSTPET